MSPDPAEGLCPRALVEDGDTHRCRAGLDGDAGRGGPQSSAGAVIVPEADLGLRCSRDEQKEKRQGLVFITNTDYHHEDKKECPVLEDAPSLKWEPESIFQMICPLWEPLMPRFL